MNQTKNLFIENWFPVPVAYADLLPREVSTINSIAEQWINANKSDIKSTDCETVHTSFYTHDDLFNLKEFETVKNIISEYVIKFLQHLNIKKNNLIYSSSWANIFYPNDSENEHIHYGSVVSGVYYVKGLINSGNFSFKDPIDTREMWVHTSCTNLIDSEPIVYKPIVGRLILFPSWLKHSVTKNNSNETRISLAFNVNINRDK